MSIPVGTLARSAIKGFNDAEDRRYIEESRATKQEADKVGLDDAKFQAGRRKKLAERTDTDYERKQAGMEAFRSFMTQDDVQAVANFANQYTRNGVKHFVNKNPDGSYDTILDVDGKKTEKHFDNKDEIGQYLLLLTKHDPFDVYEKRTAEKKAAAAKAADREHDFKKIDRKGEWELRKEGLKQGGKGTDKYLERMRKISNDMESRSKSRRGQMTALGNYDMAGISADLANYDGTIGAKMVLELGMETNDAYAKAYNAISALHKKVESEAIKKFPEDDAKQTDYIRAGLERGVAEMQRSIESRAQESQGLSPGSSMKGGDVPGNSGKQPPTFDVFSKAFKDKNPGATDDDAKQFYKKKYGIDTAKEDNKKSGLKNEKKESQSVAKNTGLQEPTNKPIPEPKFKNDYAGQRAKNKYEEGLRKVVDKVKERVSREYFDDLTENEITTALKYGTWSKQQRRDLKRALKQKRS